MKVLICDDEAWQCRQTEQAIDGRAEVSSLAGTDLKCALTALFNGIARVLEEGSGPEEAPDTERFKGFDLAIVDNNLTALQLDGARLSAEGIMGYLRAFTDVPYIVSLNKNPHVDFDLRYLFGDYQSLADLALNARHLSNPRLWEGSVGRGFAPWYWPRLEDAAVRREKQMEFLGRGDGLDRSVWDALEFPPEAEDYLSRRAKDVLLSGDQHMRDATFLAFFERSRAMPPAELQRVKQRAEEGNRVAQSATLHVTAHEVDRWLRRDVLGSQDVLVDVPHLVAQMPFLLGSRQGELQGWNDAVADASSPFGLDAEFFEAHLEKARFREFAWAPVPCFWWPALKRDDSLREHFFKAAGDWPDCVFCEDVSQFVRMSGEGGRAVPLEFEAEIDGSWPRRFVSNVDGYHYSPRSRIVGSAA